MSEKLKTFKITPNDIYNFYIVGLPFISKMDKDMIKKALMECYYRGYHKGLESGKRLEKIKYIDSLKKINYVRENV